MCLPYDSDHGDYCCVTSNEQCTYKSIRMKQIKNVKWISYEITRNNANEYFSKLLFWWGITKLNRKYCITLEKKTTL